MLVIKSWNHSSKHHIPHQSFYKLKVGRKYMKGWVEIKMGKETEREKEYVRKTYRQRQRHTDRETAENRY